MKTNKLKSANLWRIFSRRSTTAHDPWLIVNLEHFNFAGGWSQMIARQQAQHFRR
jgi:hypothetical protein